MKNIFQEKITLLLVALLLLIIATFSDLSISILLVDQNSILGRIFENHILLLVFIPVMYAGLALWKTTKNYLYLIGSGLVAVYAGFENLGKYSTGILYVIFVLVFAVVLFALVCASVFFQTDEKLLMNQDKYQKVIIAFIAIVGAIHLIKLLNGRIRYRDFNEYIEYSQFSNWYNFNLFGKGNSFPSGHTSTLYVLLPILAIYKRDYFNVRIFCYGLVLFMAFFRIRMGAHFLSDTMVGLIIAIIVELFAIPKLEQYFEKSKTSI